MGVLIAIASVFVGCCSNVLFLELLVQEDPGSGNLITFSQFVFIALIGFIFTTKFGTRKTAVSAIDYVILVLLFFSCNVLNNYAFDLNIPMPLHMIFRSIFVFDNPPASLSELRSALTEEWERISQVDIQILIESMPRRSNAVIKARGGNTKY